MRSDLIGLDGGINTFVYALSNPGRHSDPRGLYVQAIGRATYGIGRVTVTPAINAVVRATTRASTLGVLLWEVLNHDDAEDISISPVGDADSGASTESKSDKDKRWAECLDLCQGLLEENTRRPRGLRGKGQRSRKQPTGGGRSTDVFGNAFRKCMRDCMDKTAPKCQ